jgi:hypothetical protein
MIPLSTAGIARGLTHDLVGRVSLEAKAVPERSETVRVFTASGPDEDLTGYAAVLTSQSALSANGVPAVVGCRTDHLAHGDVVTISPGARFEPSIAGRRKATRCSRRTGAIACVSCALSLPARSMTADARRS